MEREKIDAALKEHVVPVLRSMGFKGSFLTFAVTRDSKLTC